MKAHDPIRPSAADICHRQDLERFVMEHSQPQYREHLTRLYTRFHEWNDAFFDKGLTVPYILFAPTSNPRALGDCSEVSGFGGLSQIRIRASLIAGTHPRLDREAPQEGRNRFIDDIFLHELIHQCQFEVTGRREASYHGHGNGFRNHCNTIGQKLGLKPVGLKPRGGRCEHPPCNHWPHNVRPQGYYLGAIEQQSPRDETVLFRAVRTRRPGLRPGPPCALSPVVDEIVAYALRVLSTPEIDCLISTLEKAGSAWREGRA